MGAPGRSNGGKQPGPATSPCSISATSVRDWAAEARPNTLSSLTTDLFPTRDCQPGSAPNEGSAPIDLPSSFLPRPGLHRDPGAIADFERLFAATIERGAGTVINYTL